MRLTALSGLGVKGPACFLLETGGTRLILDLGRGPDGDALPDVSGVGPVDAVLFSHGHADHTGGVALAARLGDPPLHATEPTAALARDPAIRAALAIPARIGDVTIETGLAGHAPGAVWMRIGGPCGLVYTGDHSAESGLFGCTLPPPAEVLVFDASYGAADEPLADQQAVLMAIAAAGPLLLPAPAGGRGLEMAVHFLEAGHPVAICPAHREVAERMTTRADWLIPRGAQRIARLLAEASDLRPDSSAQGVMVGAGPNAERGVTATLAPRFLAEATAQIVYTGHLADGTPAQAQVKSGQARFRRWNVHPTLTGTRALIDAARPRIAVPAFCTPEAAADLAGALDRPLSSNQVITW